MKFAVCSMSSTASRSPPSEILGTLAVAARPIGFARRSSIFFVPLTNVGGRMKFIDNDADQFVLGVAESRNDADHAVVDVEICRQDRSQAVRDIKQFTIGGAAG